MIYIHLNTIRKSIIRLILLVFILGTNLYSAHAISDKEAYIDSLRTSLITQIDDQSRYDCYIELSTEYLYLNFTEAQKMAEMALKIANKNNWDTAICAASIALGHSYFIQGKHTDAQESYEYARQYAEKHNDLENLAYATISLSRFFSDLAFYDKALEYANQTLLIIDKLKPEIKQSAYDNRKSTVLKSIGHIYLKTDKYEQAEKTLLEALKLMKWERAENETALLKLIADTKKSQGKTEEAIKYLYRGKRIAEENNIPVYQIYVNDYLARLFNELNLPDSAIKYAKIAIEKGKRINKESSAAASYEILADYYESQNKYQAALDYYKLAKQYHDSISAKTVMTETNLAIKKLSFEEGYLIKEQEAKIRNMRYIMLFSVLLMVISVFILLFFLQRMRLRKRTIEKKLLEKEKVMLKQDVKNKNKELSSKVMFILRRNQLIEEVIKGLQKLRPSLKKEQDQTLNEIISNLKDVFDENIWKEFEMKFVNIHPDFYEKLQEDYPDLSTNEKRICAFIRMNLATKEISYFTGMRPNTIDVARTRLRKKFELTNSGQSLEAFLAQY